MDIDKRCDSSRGEMALGQVERDGAMAGPYLVAMSDLVYFAVPRADVPPENLTVLKRYYDLKGQFDQRLADLKQQVADANPFSAIYREAAQAYNAFGAKEKELTAKRDHAAGSERMRYVDELRAMIPEGARLQRTVDDAKIKYNGWKNSHKPIAAPDPARDEQAQAIKRRIAALEPQVKEILQ